MRPKLDPEELSRRKNAGQVFQALRRRAGLTQKQLADRLGVYATYVAQIEVASSRLPPDRIEELALHLQVEVRAMALLVAFQRRPEGYWRTLTGRARPEKLTLEVLLYA